MTVSRRSTLLWLPLLAGCGGHPTARQEITVAAAANLTDVFADIGRAFEAATGAHVTYSFGATANLARQIENGAPFDVFAAADVQHVDELARRGLVAAGTRAVYARGKLALWSRAGAPYPVHKLEDVAKPEVRYIAIARPETAPYGQAAVESLKALGLWEQARPKVVYAENINMAKQYAQTGNADCAFTAYSLVLNAGGQSLIIPENLHAPLDQALAVLNTSAKQDLARTFTALVLGEQGRKILESYGYLQPA